jgi:hypothetical protein
MNRHTAHHYATWWYKTSCVFRQLSSLTHNTCITYTTSPTVSTITLALLSLLSLLVSTITTMCYCTPSPLCSALALLSQFCTTLPYMRTVTALSYMYHFSPNILSHHCTPLYILPLHTTMHILHQMVKLPCASTKVVQTSCETTLRCMLDQPLRT